MDDFKSGNNVVSINHLAPSRAKKIISELVESSGNIRFTKHARLRMKKRGITDIQIVRCLMYGNFTEEPYRSSNGNWQFLMEASDSGSIISVAGALDYDENGNHIIVITVYT